MVSIKSLVVLTFAAFAVASPILSGANLEARDLETRDLETREILTDILSPKGKTGDVKQKNKQDVRCGNDAVFSCCNSKSKSNNKAKGGLLGVAAGLPASIPIAQCGNLLDSINVAGGVLPFNFLNGGSKKKTCTSGHSVCCPTAPKSSQNSGLVATGDITVIGNCMILDPQVL